MITATIERSYPVDAATMWRLWTDPEHVARWFRPSLDEFRATVADIDPRPGGAYRLEMLGGDGVVHALDGRVVAAEAPFRLVVAWQWDGDEHESHVEIHFTEADGSTTVAITHSRLRDDEDAERHRQGWHGCLESLATVIAADAAEPGP